MKPLLYRVLCASLTIFFACALSAGFTGAAKAAADDTYLIKGVAVDSTGTSALDARNKAFVDARRKAYQALGSRLTHGATVVVPDDRVIASMVHDFSIQNEKMTSRRYAGTVNVRFTPAAVKRTLQVATAQSVTTTVTTTTDDDSDVASTDDGMGVEPVKQPRPRDDEGYVYSAHRDRDRASANKVTKAAASTRNVLVLPWYGLTGRQTLWGQGNPWRAAWEENRALGHDKTMPITLPVGDVDDVRDYSPPQPLSRRGDLDALVKRYNASQVVLALAEPQPDGGVMVSLYRIENDAPIPMGRFGVDAGVTDPLGEAVAKAATSMHGMPVAESAAPLPVSMNNDDVAVQQTAQPQMNVPMDGAYQTLARFSGLQQWVSMRQALARVPGIGDISVRSISPSQANVAFSFQGDPNNLAQSLGQNGLQLSALPPGSVAPTGPGGMTPQYMISFGRSY